jgi:type IV pilus assembly protein PilA
MSRRCPIASQTEFQNMMMKVQKGFTLIELMIVVAIIGILAAIAIPAYQDYVIRSQVSEGLAMASSLKASVAEYVADKGTWPTDTGDGTGQLGLEAPPAGKYVTGITVDNGNIVIQYGDQANDKIDGNFLVLSPGLSNNDDVIWVCGDASAPSAMASAAPAATQDTDIPGKYMPSNCRS